MVRAYRVPPALPAAQTSHSRLQAPQVSTNSSGTCSEPLSAHQGMANPPLILTDIVIAGYKRFDDKQHGDKQTTCNTAARRPSKSVWIPYRKRRFQNQGNQGGKSWDVCWEHWLSQHPTPACPAAIGCCTSLIAWMWACAERKAWKSLALGEAGVQHNWPLLPSLKLKTVCELKKQLYHILVSDAQFSKATF